MSIGNSSQTSAQLGEKQGNSEMPPPTWPAPKSPEPILDPRAFKRITTGSNTVRSSAVTQEEKASNGFRPFSISVSLGKSKVGPKTALLPKALDTSRETNREVNREVNREANRDTSREANREVNREAGRDTGREINRDTGRDTNRDTGRDTNRDTSREANREIARETNRGNSREISRETNREPNRDTPRETRREIYRAPAAYPASGTNSAPLGKNVRALKQSTQRDSPVAANGPDNSKRQVEAVKTSTVKPVIIAKETSIYNRLSMVGEGTYGYVVSFSVKKFKMLIDVQESIQSLE